MASLRGLAACVAIALFTGLPTWVTASVGALDFDWEGGKNCPLWTIEELDGQLKEKRESKRLCLVMFHVSWCKVCQRAFPEFIAAAEKVNALGLDVDFAHIDCEKSACSGYVGRGYPTIRLYAHEEDGVNRTYKSQRNVASFLKYAERMTLPAVRTGLTRPDLEKALDNETLSAFVTSVPNNKAVMAAAKQWMDVHIFASSNRLEDLLPQGVKVPAKSSLAVLSSARQQWSGHDNTTKAKPAVVFFEGNLDNKDEVADWVLRNRFPGVWKLGETNFFEFTHADRKTALLAADPANTSMLTEATWRGAVDELRGEFIFGVVDSKAWKEELTDFNLRQQDMPRILVTEDNFDVWVEDIDDLRVATASQDLRGYLNGSRQLLKQSRTTMAKLWFWHREARRYIKQMAEYADEGPLQATMVVMAALAVLIMTLLVCWGIYMLFAFLFSDPEYEEAAYMKKSS